MVAARGIGCELMTARWSRWELFAEVSSPSADMCPWSPVTFDRLVVRPKGCQGRYSVGGSF